MSDKIIEIDRREPDGPEIRPVPLNEAERNHVKALLDKIRQGQEAETFLGVLVGGIAIRAGYQPGEMALSQAADALVPIKNQGIQAEKKEN